MRLRVPRRSLVPPMAQAPRPAPGDSSGRVAASPWEPAVTASLSPAAFAPPSGNPLPSGAGPASAPAPRRWSSRRASQRRAHGAGGAAAVAAGGVDAGGSGPARLRGSGRWRVVSGAGGRAGGGSGRAVKWAADPLCPQAAARARGAGGPGGGTALRGGASGRPQLLRVRAAVRVPPRTGHPSHTPLTVPQSAAVTPSFADPSARVPQDSPL